MKTLLVVACGRTKQKRSRAAYTLARSKARVAKGLCQRCPNPRGADGTSHHCRRCAIRAYDLAQLSKAKKAGTPEARAAARRRARGLFRWLGQSR